MPTFELSDLIRRTFLLPPKENGERHRAKDTRQVVEIIDQDNGQRVENINLGVDIGNGKVEEVFIRSRDEENPSGSKPTNRNMSKSKGWTLQSSLLIIWMDENSSQQSNKNC